MIKSEFYQIYKKIKNWSQFINENVVNPDSYIDLKMQEIKELIESVEDVGAKIS